MKFSITIPAFKAKFLKECIDSVLSQTYKNFEVIIVNDASPEDLTSIVNQYDDSRIRYFINEKNCGAINVVDNWNKCLEYSAGDFIICMGDDDKLMPNCLEEYAQMIEKYPNIDAFHGRVIRIDDDSNVIDILEDRAEIESVYSLMRHRFKSRQQYIGDFCYRTSKLKDLGGFYKLPMAWTSDDITAYMMTGTKGIANTNVATFMYRINAYTISRTGNCKIKIESLNQAGLWLDSFLQQQTPKTLEEKTELNLLPNLMMKWLDAEKCSLIADSYKSNLYSIFFWLKSKRKYGLNNKHIFKALLLYFLSRKK